MNIEKIKKYKSILREWDGANASFTMFSRGGINMFFVNLNDPIKKKFISIGFTKCTFIAGPVKFKNVNINFECSEDCSEITVTDKNSDFFVKCENIYIGVDLNEVIE